MHAQGVRGYTLIELLTTLTIASILGLTSISGFNHLITHIHQYHAVQNTTTALSRARLLAVSRGERVSLCSLSIDNQCTSEWNGEYLGGFVDTNSNHARDIDEEIIFRQSWNPSLTLHWNDRFEDTTITFQPNGTAVSNGTLTFANVGEKAFANLIINNYGRVRLEKLK
ncbi:MAG: GspH/FimT family protein [Spongiibacteraceae bacterium]